MPRDTTTSFPGFCAIRADRPTNQRGGGLLTLIRGDLVFQKSGEEYSPPIERLTVQVQPSRQKWATIHNIYAAPIRSAGITDTLDLARRQMGHLTFPGGDLNVHSFCGTLTSRATHVVNSWGIGSSLTPPVSSTTEQRRYSTAQQVAKAPLTYP